MRIKRRSDGWTLKEDSLLLGTIIKYIRQGQTRLRAFDEVGETIGRTPRAVAFRFNTKILRENRALIYEEQKKHIYNKHYYKGPLKSRHQMEPLKEKEIVEFYRAIMEENERLKHDLENYKQIANLIMSIDKRGSKQSLAKGTSG